MATYKEKVSKDLAERTGCQSPEPDNRPASPLTIGSIKTVTWQAQAAPKPTIGKLNIAAIKKEDVSLLILNRKTPENIPPKPATNVGISYNYMKPSSS